MKNLFIGGLCDGEWRETPDMAHIVVSPRLKVATVNLSADVCQTHPTASYRRETLKCNRGEWHVYVSDGLSMEGALERLLVRYRPMETKEGGAA